MKRTKYCIFSAMFLILFSMQGACAYKSSDASANATNIVSQPLNTIEDIRKEFGRLSIKLKSEGKNVLCEAESQDPSYIDRAYRNVSDEMNDSDNDPVYVAGHYVGSSFRISKLKVHGQEFEFPAAEEEIMVPGL